MSKKELGGILFVFVLIFLMTPRPNYLFPLFAFLSPTSAYFHFLFHSPTSSFPHLLFLFLPFLCSPSLLCSHFRLSSSYSFTFCFSTFLHLFHFCSFPPPFFSTFLFFRFVFPPPPPAFSHLSPTSYFTFSLTCSFTFLSLPCSFTSFSSSFSS